MSYFTSTSTRKFDIDFKEKDFGSLKDILGEVLTVQAIIKIKTKNGLKSVWEFENRSDSVYFGNSILDEWADKALNDDNIVQAIKEGKVKIKIESATSKNGRQYYNVKEIN